jgi:hypothetical protein
VKVFGILAPKEQSGITNGEQPPRNLTITGFCLLELPNQMRFVFDERFSSAGTALRI